VKEGGVVDVIALGGATSCVDKGKVKDVAA